MSYIFPQKKALGELDIAAHSLLFRTNDEFLAIRDTITRVDFVTGKALEVVNVGFKAGFGLFTPDGKTLIVCGWEGKIAWLDAATLQVTTTKTTILGGITWAAMSPDGKEFLVVNYSSSRCQRWDTQTMEPIGDVLVTSLVEEAAAYSHQGEIYIGDYLGGLQRWDRETGKLIDTVPAHDGRVRAIACSPDGSEIATGGEDCQIKRWATDTGKKIGKAMRGHGKKVRALLYAGPHGLISGGENAYVVRWNLDGKVVSSDMSSLRGASMNTTLAVSPDKTRLVAAGFHWSHRWTSDFTNG